jgi:hypothetical protein
MKEFSLETAAVQVAFTMHGDMSDAKATQLG